MVTMICSLLLLGAAAAEYTDPTARRRRELRRTLRGSRLVFAAGPGVARRGEMGRVVARQVKGSS
jgi:hypothetical protein